MFYFTRRPNHGRTFSTLHVFICRKHVYRKNRNLLNHGFNRAEICHFSVLWTLGFSFCMLLQRR